jgi:hypothetical protein
MERMAEKKFPLSVIVSAVDRLTGPLRRISGTLARFHKAVSAIGKSFSNGLGVPAFTSGMREARDQFGKFLGMAGSLARIGVGFALLTAGVAAFGIAQVNAFTESASAIQDNSVRLGISAEKLQEWTAGAGLAGIKSEELVKTLQKLNINLGKVAIGAGGEVSKVFAGLGFTLKDKVTGKVKTLVAALPELADRLNKIKDPAKRAAAEAVILGSKLGPKFRTFLKEGSKGLEELSVRMARFGLILKNDTIASAEEFGDKLDFLKMVLAGVRNQVIAEMLPSLHKLSDQLLATVEKNLPAIKKFAAEFGEKLPEYIEKAAAFFKKLGTVIVTTVAFMQFFIDHANTLGAVLSAVTAVYVALAVVRLALAFKALGIAMALTPIGLIITGIALLAAGAFLLIKNWDRIKKWWLELWPLLWQATKDFLADIGKLIIQHNPFAIMVRTATQLIKLLTGIDLGKILGGKLPDWAQKLLGTGGQAATTVSTIAAAAAPVALAPRSVSPGGERAIKSSQSGSSGREFNAGMLDKKEVKVTFEMKNLPANSRVNVDNPSGVDFGLNQAYNFGR